MWSSANEDEGGVIIPFLVALDLELVPQNGTILFLLPSCLTYWDHLLAQSGASANPWNRQV